MHVSPFFVYPTTSIEEWLLVVEAVNCFGSGVTGLSVLSSMHTPSMFDFTMAGKTFTHSPLCMPHDCLFTSMHRIYLVSLPQTHSPLHDELNTHAHPISRPLYKLLALTQEWNSCSSSCTGISWFYPRGFLLRICEQCGRILSSRVDSWCLCFLLLTHRSGDCNLFPSVVCVCFPGDFVAQDGLWFFPCCDCVAVTLERLGFTQELFSLHKL